MRDAFRALDRADHDGDVGLLRDLERARVPRQQLTAFAARALRVDGERAHVRADEPGGGVDGGQGVARVFAVDRQKAAPAHERADDELAHVRRLGHERQRPAPQHPPLHHGVKVRAVVAHEEKLRIRRDLFEPLDVDLDAAEREDPAVERQRQRKVKRADAVIHPVRPGKERAHEHQHHVHKVRRHEAAEQHGQQPPVAERGRQKINHRSAEHGGNKHQIIEHGRTPFHTGCDEILSIVIDGWVSHPL